MDFSSLGAAFLIVDFYEQDSFRPLTSSLYRQLCSLILGNAATGFGTWLAQIGAVADVDVLGALLHFRAEDLSRALGGRRADLSERNHAGTRDDDGEANLHDATPFKRRRRVIMPVEPR